MILKKGNLFSFIIESTQDTIFKPGDVLFHEKLSPQFKILNKEEEGTITFEEGYDLVHVYMVIEERVNKGDYILNDDGFYAGSTAIPSPKSEIERKIIATNNKSVPVSRISRKDLEDYLLHGVDDVLIEFSDEGEEFIVKRNSKSIVSTHNMDEVGPRYSRIEVFEKTLAMCTEIYGDRFKDKVTRYLEANYQ